MILIHADWLRFTLLSSFFVLFLFLHIMMFVIYVFYTLEVLYSHRKHRIHCSIQLMITNTLYTLKSMRIFLFAFFENIKEMTERKISIFHWKNTHLTWFIATIVKNDSRFSLNIHFLIHWRIERLQRKTMYCFSCMHRKDLQVLTQTAYIYLIRGKIYTTKKSCTSQRNRWRNEEKNTNMNMK